MNAKQQNAAALYLLVGVAILLLITLALTNGNEKRLADLEECVDRMETELDAKHTQLGILTRAHKNHLRLHWRDDITEGKR